MTTIIDQLEEAFSSGLSAVLSEGLFVDRSDLANDTSLEKLALLAAADGYQLTCDGKIEAFFPPPATATSPRLVPDKTLALSWNAPEQAIDVWYGRDAPAANRACPKPDESIPLATMTSSSSHVGDITAADLSSNGRALVTTSADGTILIWHMQSLFIPRA